MDGNDDTCALDNGDDQMEISSKTCNKTNKYSVRYNTLWTKYQRAKGSSIDSGGMYLHVL